MSNVGLLLVAFVVGLPNAEKGLAGSIRGVVLNGSADRTPVPHAEVVLRVRIDGQWVVAADTRADGEGRFVFEPLPLEPELIYLAGANRDGVHYPTRRVRLTRDRPHVRLPIVVYDAVAEPSPLIARRFEVRIDCEPGVVRVHERLLVDNPTRQCYVGAAGASGEEPITLRLAIPPTFRRVTFEKEFFGRRFALKRNQLVTSIPWEPGEQELEYTYVVPNPGGRYVWKRPLDLPCSELRVWVRSSELEQVSCNLLRSSPPRAQSAEQQTLFLYEGSRLPAGYTIRVQVGGIAIPWTRYARWGAIGLLLALIGASGAVAFRPRRGSVRSKKNSAETNDHQPTRKDGPKRRKTRRRRAA
ncbi:MAG: carboxypeptidase regulatory-like domain-containing protein [Planctomycetes bacterium]|nr:carboxypeptidase regulatory-like domain-containing protein [Planctomycetota bacterium]